MTLGKNYKPFIQAHDNKVASEGWLALHLGWKNLLFMDNLPQIVPSCV